jgi:hypothetical protein
MLVILATGPEESWELVRKHVVVEFGFKVGKVPGVLLLMECESEDEVRSHLEKLPSVRDGWVDYPIYPIRGGATEHKHSRLKNSSFLAFL